jgi:hypothetical protein
MFFHLQKAFVYRHFQRLSLRIFWLNGLFLWLPCFLSVTLHSSKFAYKTRKEYGRIRRKVQEETEEEGRSDHP